MGIEALYRKPNTSRRHPGHSIYPYLLRDRAIERPQRGVGHGHNLRSDGARLHLPGGSNGLGEPAGARMASLDQPHRRGGGVGEARAPRDLQHPIRESNSTSAEFIDLLKDNGIAISMDGKGCWPDNVFVERLLKSIKYEEIYLHAYDSVSAARAGIGRYIGFYNERRPHRSLDGATPDSVYFKSLPVPLAA
jgi:putative transposase